MTRAARILTATAISVMVISAAGLAMVMLTPTRLPQATTSLTGALGGPFTLTASDDRTVTDRDFRGKWLLLYFGYTFCKDECPLALHNMGVALDRLGAAAVSVQPVFITVDPKRDTGERLAEYLKSFDPRIVGLTGTEEQAAAAVKNYQVYVSIEKSVDDYLVMHSDYFYVVNPEGTFVDLVKGNAGDELADRLRQLLKPTA